MKYLPLWSDLIVSPGQKVRIKRSVPYWGGLTGRMRRYLKNSDCVELVVSGTWLAFTKDELYLAREKQNDPT